MPTLVNMHNAKSSLSRLVKLAADGEVILIAKHGKPVAMLTRLTAQKSTFPWDKYKGEIEMSEDFDAPMDEFKEYM